MFKFVYVSFILYLCTRSEKIISLDDDWAIYDSDNTTFVYGKVPATIYHTLCKNNLIADPLFGFNDINLRNISKKTWFFSINKKVSRSYVNAKNWAILFDGLDSIVTIYINEKFIGNSSSMFKPQFYSISNVLDVPDGTDEIDLNIKLQFNSPIVYSQLLSKTVYENQIIPPECPPTVQNGECHINLIRKEQCSFSWDWGPAIPDIGIWKSAKLIAYDQAYLEEVNVFSEKLSLTNEWSVKIVVSFRTEKGLIGQSIGNLSIKVAPLSIDHSFECFIRWNLTCENTIAVPGDKVELWWPSGHGNQTLYSMDINFVGNANVNGLVPDKQHKMIHVGFRTLKLVQENCPGQVDDRLGKSFYFEVNGRPIYAKGSNWIPADLVKPSITEEYIERLLLSAKEANMNMLRVWGGGIYESDYFYAVADRLGIMIWQDAMFACALYPADDQFLDSVRQEITYQVKRLQHHPSVVVWSANNENELALSGDGKYNGGRNQEKYASDYYKLYVDTVYKNARDILGPGFPILLSSPSNGYLEIATNNTLDPYPQNPLYGDVHFYDYFSDLWDWKIYPKARFVSEYGYQGWPSFTSVSEVAPNKDEDLKLGSKFTSHRQHHSIGNFELLSQTMLHLKKPMDTNMTTYFEKFTYLTQINQAIAIKTQTEFYRRNRDVNANGQGFNMGALYWQLNDVWIAPTWSSIEYKGIWKMLHYEARNFFAPILVVLHIKNESTLVVNVVCDIPLDDGLRPGLNAKPYNFAVQLKSVQQFGLLQPTSTIKTFELSEMGVKRIAEIDLKAWSAYNPSDPHQYVHVSSDHPSDYITENRLFFHYPKDWSLNDPHIKFKVGKPKDDGTLTISLSAQAPAFYVWLDLTQNRTLGRFSENGFTMDQPSYTVQFIPWDRAPIQDLTIEWLASVLSVKTLYDVYDTTDTL